MQRLVDVVTYDCVDDDVEFWVFWMTTIYLQQHQQQPKSPWLNLQGVAKKDPSTKISISSKQRNIFVRNFQRLLGRKFAIDETSFVQYYASLRKWCDFWFSMRYFQVNAPCYLFKLKLQKQPSTSLIMTSYYTSLYYVNNSLNPQPKNSWR